jgi:cation:H+ antiporter
MPEIYINSLLIILSMAMLWLGAKYLVESAGRIAATLGVSELVIGLTVVAFGTSAPEFAVTLNAAVNRMPDISVGNIVGSNVFNLGFVLGSVALFRSIDASRKLVYRDGLFMIGSTLLLFVFFRDGYFSRIEGAILLALLVIYMLVLFMKKEAPDGGGVPQEKSTWRDYIILPLGIAAVVAGGHLLVGSASTIARHAGISEWVIGATIVAAGTSAPELVTSLTAVAKKRYGISAGNIIGSNIFNVLGVLGLAGCINPMAVNDRVFTALVMVAGMMLLAVYFIRSGWKLSRLEGAVLVGIGLAHWIFELSR